MRRSLIKTLFGALAALALAGCAAIPAETPTRVLIFSHSTGFRHASIEPGVAAIQALAVREGMVVEATEDPAAFDPGRLSGYDVLVLLSNSTKPKDPASEYITGARRTELQRFLADGNGIVAIHAASDSHYNWPFYGAMIGGWFAGHPPGAPTGALRRTEADHPSVRALPQDFTRADEWYGFKDVNPNITVLLTLDPASIGKSGASQPISWAHRFEGGRVFYTAMGHTVQSYAEPLFLDHLGGGLRWAAGREE
jgi:type 1 glutamine amidotransferase